MAKMDYRATSEKYPGLNLIQEVAFDWIIDFYFTEGVMPTYQEVAIGLGVGESRATHIIQRLCKLQYIHTIHGQRKSRRIRRFGIKYRMPGIKTLFEKIYVGPIPRRLTWREAMAIGWALYSAGEELKKATGRVKKKKKPPTEAGGSVEPTDTD